MRLRCFRLLPVIILMWIGGTDFCGAAELSADLVSRSWMGVVTTAKVLLQGEKVRIVYGTGQHRVIDIYRGDKDKGVWWMLNPQDRTYTELCGRDSRWTTYHQSSLEYLGLANHDVKPMIAGKQTGTESVNGYVCQKFVYNILNKRGQIAAHLTQWYSSRLGIPIKLQYKSGDHIVFKELRNITEKKLKDSLFEVPAGYRKIVLPRR